MKEAKKAHVHSHGNPEILKLGFGSMALYKKRKPSENKAQYETSGIMKAVFEAWQSSRLAYMKEPEFKEGDIVHDMVGNNYIFKGFYDENKKVLMVTIPNDKDKDPYTYGFIREQLSHYHEDQGINLDKFKYVKKVKVGDTVTGGGTSPPFRDEWQEVKEPALVMYSEFEETEGINANWENDHEIFQSSCREGTILLGETT